MKGRERLGLGRKDRYNVLLVALIGDWHWALVVVWLPAVLLPLLFILLPLTEGWHLRRFEHYKRREQEAGRMKGTYEMPEHPAETGLILTFLYLVTIAPVLTLLLLFLNGTLAWPLSALPLAAEIYLAALPFTLFVALVFLSYDNEEGALLFVFVILVGTPALVVTLLATGEWVLPIWTYVILAAVFLPPIVIRAAMALTGRPLPYSSARESIEGLVLVYLMVALPLGIAAALYLITGTLLALLALPAVILIAVIISGFGEGGDGSFLDFPFSITRS